MDSETAINTEIAFYLSPQETWDAMYRDCQNAKESIEFEQYILNKDELGEKFAALFAEKAKQNVAVRLILDKVGSSNMVSSPYFKEIRDHGGEVHFYNPITWFNIFLPHTWYPRNHTKTMLIDSKIAYTGGVCLAAYMHNWRDTQARFTGSMTSDVKNDFVNLLNAFRHKRRSFRSHLPTYTSKVKEKIFRYVVSKPHVAANPIYKEMLNEIWQSKKNICIVTPYFLPPRKLRKALYAAARRGVKVRVMTSMKTDVPLADYVGRSYFKQMIHFGIEVLLFRKTVLHAKYAVIDESWATIGSMNIDYLSLTRNREANIVLRDKATISELQSHFENDMQFCDKAGPDYYDMLPPHVKLIGFVGRIFRRFI